MPVAVAPPVELQEQAVGLQREMTWAAVVGLGCGHQTETGAVASAASFLGSMDLTLVLAESSKFAELVVVAVVGMHHQ
jgi:hypothetical protein